MNPRVFNDIIIHEIITRRYHSRALGGRWQPSKSALPTTECHRNYGRLLVDTEFSSSVRGQISTRPRCLWQAAKVLGELFLNAPKRLIFNPDRTWSNAKLLSVGRILFIPGWGRLHWEEATLPLVTVSLGPGSKASTEGTLVPYLSLVVAVLEKQWWTRGVWI